MRPSPTWPWTHLKWSNWIHQLPERRADSGAARRGPNSVCVLVPDNRATPRGFHDATLVDMTGETGPTVSMGEISNDDSGPHLCWRGRHDDRATLHLLSEPLIPLPNCGASRHWPGPAARTATSHHQRSCHGRGRLMHRLRRPPVDIHRVSRVPFLHDNLSWEWTCQCRHFVRCTDTPSSVFGVCGCAGVGPVAGSSPGRVATGYGPPGCPNWCVTITAGRQVDGIKPHSAQPVCDRIASHVNWGTTIGIRPGVLSFTSGRRRCAGAPRTSRINTDGGLWCSPGGPGPDTVHHDGDCPGCPRCPPRPSG